jgi:signal transduction histidine kinase
VRLHRRCALALVLSPLLACAPRAPDLIFIVLDTVRSDYLSACGHPSPTSPHLEALAALPESSFTCLAEAPATWTIPSHASFLTGLHYPDHGAGSGGFQSPSPLPMEVETLAQSLADRYQTLLVSGNPLLDKAGLERGFESAVVAERYAVLYGDALVEALARTLAARDSSRPLFLLLNISDAHLPWASVPAGHPWLPATRGLQSSAHEATLRRRLYSRQMDAEEEADYLARRRRLYAYAVERADRVLGDALAVLREAGLLRSNYRLVVTSDHGERLGEQRMLGHGAKDLRESVTRVPLLWMTDRGGALRLPEPMSALEAHSLLLDGRLRGLPVIAVGSVQSVAWWEGEEKLVWLGGRPLVRYSTLDDSGDGEVVEDHPRKAELERLRARLLERWEATREGREDPERTRLGRELGALGYVDDPDDDP